MQIWFLQFVVFMTFSSLNSVEKSLLAGDYRNLLVTVE